MSETRLLPIRATFAGRWQIPILALALCLLIAGLCRIALGGEKLTFNDRLDRVRQLRGAGALTRANAYLLYLLKEFELAPEQRGEVHRQLAVTIHQAEAGFVTHSPDNLQSIITNFHTAVRFGATPETQDWVALGEAYQWSGRQQDAITSYRQALRFDSPRSDRIRRKLIELQFKPGQSLRPELLLDLEAILADENASPDNYHWALEQKAQWLLSRGETSEALALIEEAKTRLAGTAEKLALSYTEALCLWQADQRVEAETRLRSLRNHWRTKDELWGRTGWLLGRLQQEDGRPQTALSFYEDVLDAFQSGDLHDACELGRAESLVMLRRYERALEVFERLKRRALEGVGRLYLDRDALRTVVATAGESRLRAGERRLGLRFLELALSLADESQVQQRSRYLSRIAAELVALAEELKASTKRVGSDEEAKLLFAQAAERYQVQADILTLDEGGSARALLLAGDNFDAAGRTDKVIEVLTDFVQGHPAHPDRADALHRLGRAYQAVLDFPAAIDAYETVIKEYPRTPATFRSMVPLSESLLSSGGEHVERGVNILIDIVDDRGADPLFGPKAEEYRLALFRLAEYYSQAKDDEIADHFEKAIVRLEEAVALYPADPKTLRLKFLLAEAYRQSAQSVREDEQSDADAGATYEINRRLTLALQYYSEVKSILARHDATALTDLEEAYLQASYLYIGDCLFDLQKLEEAIEAYREAAWRYENLPAAVSATMQVVHCYQRLGRLEESRAALARLQWLLKKIPADAFDAERGMTAKSYWDALAKRIERTGIY